MELSGERRVAAPKEKIWAALNDPAILQSCIPGGGTVEKLSETELMVRAAGFTGKVLLSDLDPPNGATFSSQGEGGGRIELLDDTGGSRISYKLNAGTGQPEQARDAVDTFLERLAAAIAATPAATNVIPDTAVYHLAHEDHDHDPSNPHYFGLPIGVLLAAAAACISVGIVLAKFFIID